MTLTVTLPEEVIRNADADKVMRAVESLGPVGNEFGVPSLRRGRRLVEGDVSLD